MKTYFYRLFRNFFDEEMYEDTDIQKFNDFQLLTKEQIESDKRLEYQRGYEDGQQKSEQLIDKLATDRYTDKHWLVNPVNVLYASESGQVFINREPITKDEIKVLKEEIRYLTNCRIWSIFQETLRAKAIEKAVMHSTNFEQVLAGKMMVHNLGIIKSIVETIEKLKV